jgi:hypothetical protein
VTPAGDRGVVIDINVDDFCKDAGRALLVLYRAFPRPHTLFVEDLCGPGRTDEFGLPSDRHVACFSALVWLAEEGLLRFVDTIRQEAVDQAVLTGRCFSLLSTPAPDFDPPTGVRARPGIRRRETSELPESLRLEQQTYVYRLEQALAERSSTRVREVVLDLIRAFVRQERA